MCVYISESQCLSACESLCVSMSVCVMSVCVRLCELVGL